jgi:hypothetical protein
MAQSSVCVNMASTPTFFEAVLAKYQLVVEKQSASSIIRSV